MSKPKFTTSKTTIANNKGEAYDPNYLSWLVPGAAAFDTNMYVPEWFLKLFPGGKSEKEDERAKALETAGIVQNAIGSSILALGLVGATRWLMGKARKTKLADISSDNPADKLTSHVNTVYAFDPEEGKSKLAGQDKKAFEVVTGFSGGPVTQGVKYLLAGLVPTLSALATAGLADSYFSKENGKAVANEIDNELSKTSPLRDSLVYARAANAKGKLTEEELAALNRRVVEAGIAQHIKERDKDMKKKGALDKRALSIGELWAGISMGSAALLASSFLGSYAYVSAREPNNIKYNAIKKGLKEYAKTKSGTTPIYIMSNEYDPFAKLDETPGAVGQAASEQEASMNRKAQLGPEVDASGYKPISVTL